MVEDVEKLLPAPLAALRAEVSRQLLNYWRSTGAIEPVEYRAGKAWYRIRDLINVTEAMAKSKRSYRAVPRPGAGRRAA